MSCERLRRSGFLSAALLVIGCGGSGGEPLPGWPKQVTVSSPQFAQVGEAVRLADGKIVADGGDVALSLAVQVALVAGDLPDSFCLKGTYATLASVPTDAGGCVDSIGQPHGWVGKLFLSGAIIHTNEESSVIGLGALVMDRAREATYRLRVLGDSVMPNEQGEIKSATATFEYEPIPGQ